MTDKKLVDELIANAFKRVKFTRGKKQERIERIKWIREVYGCNRNKLDYWRNNQRCISIDSVFTRIESIFNDRSLFKSLDIYEKVLILFMFYSLDFGDSVQVSDEDFWWLYYNRYHLVDTTSYEVAHDIILRCPIIRDILG